MAEVNQADIEIDFENMVQTMTLAEMMEVEEITGTSFRNIDWEGMPAAVLRALVYVSVKRDNPEFTIEDAGNVRLMGLLNMGTAGEEVAADPTPQHAVNGVG